MDLRSEKSVLCGGSNPPNTYLSEDEQQTQVLFSVVRGMQDERELQLVSWCELRGRMNALQWKFVWFPRTE